jgi:hypothetical protein
MRPFLNYINSQNEATKKKQKTKEQKTNQNCTFFLLNEIKLKLKSRIKMGSFDFKNTTNGLISPICTLSPALIYYPIFTLS